MSRIVDLSVPIEPHFRWPMERSLKSDHAGGGVFQVTWLGLAVHGFTHIDAARHILPGGATSSDTPLEQTCGEAAIVDVSDLPPNHEITRDQLAARGGHVRKSDIVLLRSRWDEKRSLQSREFWTEAPWLSRGACEWLLERGIKALAPDFPQDYPIRLLLDGETRPLSEFAIIAISRTLAFEEIEHGVRVNSLCPGYTMTPFHIRRGEAEGRTREEILNAKVDDCLMQRWAAAREIALPILWLASDEASYVTAANFMIDGGRPVR